MIAVAVVAVLGFVVVAVLWSRVAGSRSERRSVEGYGRALDTLGGVAKRTESGAPVQAPAGDELARPHVKPAEGVEPHARPPAHPLTPAPRIRLRPPGPSGAMPVFSDLSDAGAEQPPPAVVGDGPRALAGDEPTMVLPLEGRPAPSARNGGAPDARGAGPAPEEPLTMLLPAVRADAPQPLAPPLGPIYGPPLPDEAVESGNGRLDGEGEGTPPPTTHPLLVFDAEVGAPVTGPDDGGLRHVGEERTLRIRRAATGAAAVVALGALGAGGWQLASDSGSHAPPSAATRSGSRNAAGHDAGGSPGTTAAGTGKKPVATGAGRATGSGTAPTGGTGSQGGRGGTSAGGAGASATGTLQPTSASSSLVAYEAPAGTYTITFSVVGSSDCWLGAQATPGGSYLWMQTLAPGGTTTYTATGPVVIRLGAPPVVAVEVNGRKVALPPANVQPYDISFTPSGRAA